ncbi:SHOCT domain-containing protein [Paenibacillus sp. SN-8-1]|uniref:SHOCT domain-containing protein n=1 Tax=Paenibacillus sp. SN-8-1 TaxID=3435409 RepID=UPI003D9A4D29
MGMIVGGIFTYIGLTLFASMGWFGIVWTLIAVGITIGHAFNFFGKRGVSTWEIEVDDKDLSIPRKSLANDIETRLRRLERLKEEVLISDDEYRQKRKEIMNEKW